MLQPGLETFRLYNNVSMRVCFCIPDIAQKYLIDVFMRYCHSILRIGYATLFESSVKLELRQSIKYFFNLVND